MQIGITERGDAALSIEWLSWVKDGKPAILITKDPEKLAFRIHAYFPAIQEPNIIVHCGITGRGGTIIEPNVPPLESGLKGYRTLIDMLGKDRVVLRLDPVFPNQKGLDRAAKVVRQHEGTRIRLAFLHAYPHVKRRFEEAGATPPKYDFYAPLIERKRIYEALCQEAGQEIEVCGEPGFECTGCVSEKDTKILGVTPAGGTSCQRRYCACLAQKKELLTGKKQCEHKCIYCYWK